MGCFAVSCGVTRMSIRDGEGCVLIPITTKEIYDGVETGSKGMYVKSHRKPYVQHETCSSFCYNDELWQPCMLPIHGNYDDYGGLCDIRKDMNTEILEERYGISIEDIVELITDGRRSPYDYFSSFCDKFFIDKQALESDDNIALFDKLFEKKDGKNHCIYKDENVTVYVDKNDDKNFTAEFTDKNTANKIIATMNYDCELDKFLKDYYEITGILIGINNPVCYELLCTGGMFVLEYAYETLVERYRNLSCSIDFFAADQLFLLGNGFEPTDGKYGVFEKTVNGKKLVASISPNKLNGEHYYSIEEFTKLYKKFTRESLDVGSRYKSVYKTRAEYYEHSGVEFFREITANFDGEKEGGYIFVGKSPSIKEINDYLDKHKYISGIQSTEDSFPILKQYNMLSKIYAPYMLYGFLEDNRKRHAFFDLFVEYEWFIGEFNNLNTLYLPSFCSTQCGDLNEEIFLAYLIDDCVEKRKEEK